MTKNKILHIMILDKFLAPFIDFVDEHFGRVEHHYVFITSEKYDYGLTPEHNVEFLHTDDDIFITLLEYMKISKKIILHGLWRDKVDVLLYFNQELLKKCYWVMWGGDFYFPETKSKIRHEVIKNMGNCIPVTYGDYKYIQKHYKTKAVHHKCLNYPRSLNLKNNTISTKLNNKDIIKILVGNSATKTNKHIEIFDILKKYANDNIELIIPLNYGDIKYRDKIITCAHNIFGDKFKPIIDYMNLDKYIEILNTVDIAIFNNNRQQAVGNILQVINLGKTLYLSNENNIYETLLDLNIKFFDILELKDSLSEIPLLDKKNNQAIIYSNYSEEKSVFQWKKIFKKQEYTED